MIAALSMSLLHFLWQGALLGVLAALALRVPARKEARLRYGIACAFFATMAAAPFLTFAYFMRMTQASAPTIHPPLRTVTSLLNPQAQGQLGEGWVSSVLLVWAAGVVVFSLRAAGGLSLVMSRVSVKSPAPEQVLTAAQRIARSFGIRKLIPVFTSTRINVPIVFGALRPIIVLPCSALTGLSQSQLEAILAHELAHIVRHDFLINCFQTAVEVVLFYHPAVWWLSGRIRLEREMCCDEMAAGRCGDRLLYSRALLALEEGREDFVPAATGGNLRRRIEHLLGQSENHVAEPRAAAGLIAVLTCSAVVILSLAPGIRAQSTEAQEKEHRRRISYANERFSDARPGTETDRGKIYVEKGPPDEIESHPAEHREAWRYKNGDIFEFSGPQYDLKASDSPARHFPPTGEKRLWISRNVQKQKLVSAPEPEYPATARVARQQGVVMLAVLINKEGRVQDVAVMSGAPLLAEAAANAVRQWTYQTTLLNGAPVEVVTTVDVPFRLME
jgi:TonB family protein